MFVLFVATIIFALSLTKFEYLTNLSGFRFLVTHGNAVSWFIETFDFSKINVVENFIRNFFWG